MIVFLHLEVMGMKWTREEYIELMTFGKLDRPMFVELFGPLVGLSEEWAAQGATDDELSLAAFDFDYVPMVNCGASCSLFGAPKSVTVEDTPEYKITIDGLGRRMKMIKGYATLPLPLDFPVTDMDSWLKIKPFYRFNEKRIDWEKVEEAKRLQGEGVLVRGSIPGGFDVTRELMGEENLCIAYYEDPELIHDILDTVTDTSYKVFERINDKLVIDNLCIHEDMAGKSGPLIGPNIIEEFLEPYYTKIWGLVSSNGTKLFSQDSDGNMEPVIDAFIKCGVNVMYPFEPAAGMDMVKTREKYGSSLAIKGGIDKHVLRQSKEDIRRELEYKLQPSMHNGTVFGLDHRIPNGTPLENYKYYVDTAREILGLPPRDGKVTPHVRMAF